MTAVLCPHVLGAGGHTHIHIYLLLGTSLGLDTVADDFVQAGGRVKAM